MMKRSDPRYTWPLLLLLSPLIVDCSGSRRTLPDEAADEAIAPDIRVTIDASVQLQTLEGFGASVAWYADLLAQHPNRAELARILFSDLGLDILRLRNEYAAATKAIDTNVVEVLRSAEASLGHAPRVLLTSWSPPAELKASGVTRCSGNSVPGCTLRNNADGSFPYAEFAAYWVESLQAYQALGIAPYYVSIQNEPDFVPGSWDGCRFDPVEQGGLPGYDRALNAVSAALSAANLATRLLGPDSAHLANGQVLNYLGAATPGQLYGVAHHLYDGQSWSNPDNFYMPMSDLALAYPDLPKFQTEFSPTDDQGKAVQGGFEVAWLIHNAIATEGAAAYLHWELVWPTSGLVAIESPRDPTKWTTPNGYTIREPYYAMRHFARYTDPGDHVVASNTLSSDVIASAYLSPDQSRLTVVVLNTAEESRRFALDLSGYQYTDSVTYVTTQTAPWQPGPTLEPGSGNLLPLEPRSILTLVFANDPLLLQ